MKLPDLSSVISADLHAQPCSILGRPKKIQKVLDPLTVGLPILSFLKPKGNNVVTFKLLLFNSFKPKS